MMLVEKADEDRLPLSSFFNSSCMKAMESSQLL